ncbi:MAG: M48 family metalloprotease, partial [Acidobacteriota bacterium]|nr:M48 family metalloprotease [Acidobacteriota bacterium]
CQAPLPATLSSSQNIFSEQQEMDLGDAVAEHLQRNHRVIDDEEVTGHLRRIGERLIKHLPPTSLRFQFFLFDVNDVNAFTLPGGRIYVSRKLVAFSKNEDELAGVIAHELGHIMARHSAVDMTTLLREVLGVTQVTDRRDIFTRYNELIENAARKPKAFEKLDNHEAGNQNVADLIGLYVMARAGYDPQAQTALWDRYNELKGKTGGFLADLFGRTKPEQKRLREMLRGLASMPPECIGAQIQANAQEFQEWQTAVVSYTGLGKKESVGGLTVKKVLNPALRSDINHLRFSPDGKFILAQDDSGINVLARQPFAALFRIHAPDARPAQFTPDSKQIVFHTPNLRVETWNIGEQKLQTAREVVARKTCLQTLLSPDGSALACLDSEFGLSLIDIQSGSPVFEKKSFTRPGFFEVFSMLFAVLVSEQTADLDEREFINMSFSPDGHYFLAGDRSMSVNAVGFSTDVQSLVYDLTTRQTISVKGDFKNVLSSGFAFVGPDKIIGKNLENSKKAGLYGFPSGQVIEHFEMFGATLKSVTLGNYVLLQNYGKLSGAIMDLSSRRVFNVSQRPVLDGYEDTVASERRNGELGLFGLKGGQPQVAALPQGVLGRLYAADVTPDFKWLAVSGYSRGAVWDLSEGKMVLYVRGFRGVHIEEDGTGYADFPKLDQVARTIARLDSNTKTVTGGSAIDGGIVNQSGPYLTRIKPAKEGGSAWENVTLEISSVRGLAPLWSIAFRTERPWFWVAPGDHTITLLWTLRSKAASTEIKSSPELQRQMAAIKEKEGDYLIKSLDLHTGKVLGQLLVETGKGSFRIKEVFTSGDWVVVVDTQNRVLIYSLKDGRQVGKVFGKRPTISVPGNLLSVETDEGVLTLYDLNSFAKRQQFSFSSPVAMTRFSFDGKRLFVLTANQNVYLVDVSAPAGGTLAD